MRELTEILLEHAARYPAMEPIDAVKLIYQNEFGGGHMIHDEQSCLAYLRREYALTHRAEGKPLIEEIGNGIVRVNLAALPDNRVEELGAAFIRSAALQQGSGERFRKKLDLLRGLCADGQMPFASQAMEAYLAQYEQAGFPAVSHSDTYRQAYHPAYRIVKKTEFALSLR